MTVNAYYRLDDVHQKSLVTKSQLIELAHQEKIKLSVKCNNQRGLVFSYEDGEVVAHQFGAYNGFLQLSKDAVSMLAEKGSHLLTVGKIEQINQFKFNETLPKEIYQYLYDRWEVLETMHESKEYGLFLNVESGETFDGAIDNHERSEKLKRYASYDDPKLNPYSESRNTMRDVSLLGDVYSSYQLQISKTELEKAKSLLKKGGAKPKLRRTAFTQLLVKIIKDNIHYSSDQIWQVLEKEIASQGVRKYDDDLILLPNDSLSIKWENSKGKKTTVKYEGFASRVSRVRTNEGLNKF